MEVNSEINIPPEKILKPNGFTKPNYEHIILWMLYNNEECEWAHFTGGPVGIPQSTFSNYKNRLERNGFIEKVRRGFYQITDEGKERYNIISQPDKQKRRLSYPPKIIKKRRNYDDIILWTVYNNNYCKWSDFLNPPLSINQSSLSKNMNILKDAGLINKEEKEYKITQAGKMEYSRMLGKYDLDRHSILDEESKRIEEITKKIRDFFSEKNVNDFIKFRFLSNVLKLDYSTVENLLPNEKDFFKILLFISVNHPNEYPNYVSLSKFARDHQIEERILNYYIPEIVDTTNLYSIKFYKLKIGKDRTYYFRSDDKFERNLRTLVDDSITRLTYLNKLYKDTSNEIPESKFYDTIINNILNRAVGKLVPEDLRVPLLNFLPEYISHQLYKFDTESEIRKSFDKFDVYAYDTMSNIFQALKPISAFEETGEEGNNYFVDPKIFKFLKPIRSTKLEFVKEKLFKYSSSDYPKDGFIDLVDSALKVSPNDLELIQLKAIILCVLRKYNRALNYLRTEIDFEKLKDKEEDFITTLFIAAYANIGVGRYTKALEISDKIAKRYPQNKLFALLSAFIFAYNMIYEFDPDNPTDEDFNDQMKNLIEKVKEKEVKSELYQFYGYILQLTDKNQEALDIINKAVKINPTKDVLSSQSHYLFELERYDEAIDILKKIGREFPEKEDDTKFKIASLYYKIDRVKESKELLEGIIDRNPKKFDYLNSQIYTLAHLDLREEAIKQADKLIEGAPTNGNYHDSYGEILMMFEEYEKAIEIFQKAIELEPNGWFVYETFIKLGRCQMKLGYNEEAIRNFNMGKAKIEKNLPCCKKHFTWVEKANRYLKQLNAI